MTIYLAVVLLYWLRLAG